MLCVRKLNTIQTDTIQLSKLKIICIMLEIKLFRKQFDCSKFVNE